MSSVQNPVNWFEIPATDIERAKTFYTASLGFAFEAMEMGPAKMAMFPMDTQGFGAGGSLTQAEHYTPSHTGTLIYFPVPDINATLGKIGDAGGKTLAPKMSIGEHGQIAMFEDSEGNRVGLHTPPSMG